MITNSQIHHILDLANHLISADEWEIASADLFAEVSILIESKLLSEINPNDISSRLDAYAPLSQLAEYHKPSDIYNTHEQD